MLSEIFSFLLLVWGFVFTFFLPGASLTEFFWGELPARIKFFLYFILSVFVSTFLTYLVSLVIGFSRYSILVSSAFFLPAIWVVRHEIRITFKKVWRNHRWALIMSGLIYLIFCTALFPAIFTQHNDYFVMASVNWQDTAMHQSIIQSLSQGNFPPQAPYYAGTPLNYYYFVDFHSAIITTLYGKFFPRVLVYDNPLFATIFFLGVYCLSFEVTKKKNLSLVAGIASTFFGSLLFTSFIKALLNGGKWRDLLTHNTYSMEYEKLFQMSNLADYFLQNRPMMFGLPAFLVVLLLLLYNFQKKVVKIYILIGFLVGMLIKFQFFALIVSLIGFSVIWPFGLFKNGKKNFLGALAFAIPLLIFIVLFVPQTVSSRSSLLVLKESFSFGSWERGKDIYWHVKFLFLNVGQIILFGLVSFLISWKKNKPLFFISLLFVIFLILPYSVRFTIYKYDMFKFFYFAVPLGVISTVCLIDKFLKFKIAKIVAVAIFVITCSLSSLLTLVNSYLNKNTAYSQSDLTAGMWIRENTPQKSVFTTAPTVHSAVADIGGRLRVLSYINWPYSHGFNQGIDNVFVRLGDLKNIYTLQNDSILRTTLTKYQVDYIYLTSAEKNEWKADNSDFFDNQSYLRKIYFQDNIAIYEVL